MKAIGAGFVTADILQFVDAQWRPEIGLPSYSSGGTVSNILSYLARFGWSAAILGEIGDDEFGEHVVRRDLNDFGVDTTMLAVRPRALTRRISHLVVSTDGDRERGRHRFETFCMTCDNAFPSFPTSQPERLIPKTDGRIDDQTVLIIDRANDLTLALAMRVKAAGGVVVFEPGAIGRDADVVSELLTHVSILKYSHDLRWGGELFRERLPADATHGHLVIETRDRNGVRAMFRDTEIRLTTTPIMEVVDSAGAGDAFTAGFLTGLGPDALLGLADVELTVLEDALTRGQALGGLACRFVGGKGLLYAKESTEVEAAITLTITDRRPPAEFESQDLPVGRSLPPALATMCPVCRLEVRHDV